MRTLLQAQGSNAGASFAGKYKRRAALTGMAASAIPPCPREGFLEAQSALSSPGSNRPHHEREG